MSSVATGNSGSRSAWRVSTEQTFDPKLGYRTREEWEGIKSVVIALRNAWTLAGWKSIITHRGPRWRVQVEFGFDPSQAEVPVDQWEIDMEPVQVSIWNHPDVDADIIDSGQAAGLYRKDVEDAIKNGSTSFSGTETQEKLYRLLARGCEAYEIKRAVITRTRTFSLTYGNTILLDQTEKVYTNAALIRVFSLPSGIQRQLPDTSGLTTPTDCVWAWKNRTDRSVILPALGKVQETKDWVFAAWSTLFYTAVLA